MSKFFNEWASINTFIDDYEKMYDFKHLEKEEFLKSYSYLTEKEYDKTKQYYNWLSLKFDSSINEIPPRGGNVDIWGVATVWLEDQYIGAEYNYCIETEKYNNFFTINSSAIYRMDANEDYSIIDTDTSDFEHYEIDLDNPDWERDLLFAMEMFIAKRI